MCLQLPPQRFADACRALHPSVPPWLASRPLYDSLFTAPHRYVRRKEPIGLTSGLC